MTKEEILAVVVENLKDNVDDLEDVDIDSSKSMADYGASSLDAAAIASDVTRHLKIKVPKTELLELKNINDLVNLLFKKLSE